MESTTTPTAADAATVVRTWNGTKATLTVTLADGTTFQLGGDRAARAQAVIIGKTLRDGTVGHWGVRANLAKAQTEAVGLAQGRTRLVRSPVRGQRGRRIDVPPVAEWAVAVPVTDQP